MSDMGASRIALAPAVADLVAADGPAGDLARAWLRYSKALIGEDGIALADVATQEVCCIDLELFGLPPGFAAFQAFRDGINTVMPDESLDVLEMTVYPSQGIVETLTRCAATHGTQLLGVQPTGRRISWEVKTLGHFVDGRLTMRWDRVDVPAFMAQLEGGD
jgi:predicted ester cyclase